MHRFANPARFLKIAQWVLPIAASLAAALIGAGVYMAFFASPEDYQQGNTVRIMYVHVPSAWMAMGCYSGLAISSAMGLIWTHPLAHMSARAIAPVGACFTAAALITGALWGQPMWGTWWVWDARLTSVLILLFLYLGYMALWSAFDDESKAERACAILALVGAVNLPVIKFSVDWWNTLHQPASVMRLDGPTIDGSMMTPLLLMGGGFMAYVVAVTIIRIRAEIDRRTVEALTRAQIQQAQASSSAGQNTDQGAMQHG